MEVVSKNRPSNSTFSSGIAEAENYTNWVIQTISPYLRGSICEIGVGHGSYHKHLKLLGNYTGIEIDRESVQTTRELFPDINIICGDICDKNIWASKELGKQDSIICSNVLEHIDDHQLAFNNLWANLNPNGHLCILVPAFEFLYSDMDKLAGHIRRYNFNLAKQLLPRNAFELVHLKYFNPIGGMGWWLNKFLNHQDLDSKNINKQIRLFDRYILPFSKILDPVTRSFFGQSMIMVVRKC